jgi:hypothetical protein
MRIITMTITTTTVDIPFSLFFPLKVRFNSKADKEINLFKHYQISRIRDLLIRFHWPMLIPLIESRKVAFGKTPNFLYWLEKSLGR